MALRPTKGYVIEDRHGFPHLYTVSLFRKDCIAKYEEDHRGESWEKLRRKKGVRVAKIIITEDRS